MNNIDIDILEKFCEIKINSYAMKFVDISYPDLQQAISKLISENKELKEKYSRKLIDFQKEREEYEKDYIPKSKVEEVIREYKKKGNSVGIPHLYGAEIELLQSLLGKE